MRTTKLFYLFAGVIMSLIAVLSCKDNFSEEDFLRLQQQLARQRDSLNAVQQGQQAKDAGLLLSWTIQVQDNRKPVQGAQVAVKGGSSDSTQAFSASTDADGIVTFTNVPVGREIVRITKTGYLTANLAVEFDANQLIYTGSTYMPIRRAESSIIPLFSVTSTETATINGTATVETDLTNSTREKAPSGTVIRANISEALQQANLIYPESSDPSINTTQRILSYAVEGGENIGVGTVDASGNFSLRVPALSEGTQVTFIYDNFQATVKQAVMFDENTGNPITPAYASLSRWFGPDYSGNAAPVQWVPGALAVFPNPPAMATGFAVNNFTALPRDLGTWSSFVNFDDKFSLLDIGYWIKSVGSKLTQSPAVSITGGGGSGATMEAWLQGYVTGITVTNRGSSFTPSATFSLQINWLDNDANLQYVNSFAVVIGADGKLPAQIDVPASGDNGTYGLNADNPFFTTVAQGFKVKVFDESSADVTSSVGVTANVAASIYDLAMTDGGSGYTSAPTITFSGGGTGAVLPAVQVTSFATAYSYSLVNSGNSGNYIFTPHIDIYISSGAGVYSINNQVDAAGGVVNGTGNINDLITVSSGDIAYTDPTLTYQTQRSSAAPYASVTDFQSKPPLASVDIDTEGKVNGLTVVNGNEFGMGYNSPFGVTIQNTIAAAPGSGAVISLTDFNHTSSGEYQWVGEYNVVSKGTNYLQQLNYPFDNSYYTLFKNNTLINVRNGDNGNFPAPITVYPGDTYTLGVFYGTGAVTDVSALYPGFVVD